MVPKEYFRSRFWTPDIYFYHVHRVEKRGIYEVEEHVRIANGSDMYVMGSVLVEQNCKFGFNWYPFDDQTCIVAVGSNWLTEDMVNFTGIYWGPRASSRLLFYLPMKNVDSILISSENNIASIHHQLC